MEIGEELGSGQGGSETSGAGSGNLGVAGSEDAVVEAQQPVTLTAATEAVASVAHPKANEQVEVTIKTIVNHLKTRCIEAKSNWADEVPNIL